MAGSERRPVVQRGYIRRGNTGYVDERRSHLRWIRLVCEAELREALVDIAARDDVTLSEVVRRACRRYVEVDEGIGLKESEDA